jgi:hypothetical protein
MKSNPEFFVYLAGIAVFGLFYDYVKAALDGGLLFVSVAAAYLLMLRGVGVVVRRWLERGNAANE